MKEIILLLIQDDIKTNRLITNLRLLSIDAEDYNRHNSTVIFYLLEMSEKEDLMDKYFKMVEGGDNIHFTVDNDRDLSARILAFLLGYANQKVIESLT